MRCKSPRRGSAPGLTTTLTTTSSSKHTQRSRRAVEVHSTFLVPASGRIDKMRLSVSPGLRKHPLYGATCRDPQL
jgi:hypothetical protein